ncbi:hypothetical protein AtubIFM61612_005549 [Aspergillus tubingensis]|nr:hypothetical protein AtubIFM57143_003238 [Aspergillus tubingensis]GLB15722.1 hypothetical protein AtubIFM61612_005549 [Aspergillus tubingensis]
MGSAQSIPVVGEVVTLAEAGGKAAAGGVCALFGQDKQAHELLAGAERSLVNYTEVNLEAANLRMAVAAFQGDHKMVSHLQETQAHAWTEVAENTPIVGHGIGIYHYARGETEAGDRCMMGASRTGAVMVATFATGGAGALACAGVAAGTGLVVDGVETALNSLGKHEFAPVGTIGAIKHACDTGSADDVFNAAAAPVADGAFGALDGYLRVRPKKVPARTLAERSRNVRPSVCEEYKTFTELPNQRQQATLAEVNRERAGAVRVFDNPLQAMRNLEAGSGYDFVRLPDGTIRAIQHHDAAEVSQILNKSVGHTSLVDSGARVVAAGEVYLDNNGVITNLNPQSGHFRLPIEIFSKQIGKAFPRSAIVMDAPHLMALTALTTSRFARNLPAIKIVAVYTLGLFVVIPANEPDDIPTPLADSKYVVAVHEHGFVKSFAVFDLNSARAAYDAIKDAPKLLYDRVRQEVLMSDGDEHRVRECERSARMINSVQPRVVPEANCRDRETWQDLATGKWFLRCKCRRADGTWVDEEVEFREGDELEWSGDQLKVV